MTVDQNVIKRAMAEQSEEVGSPVKKLRRNITGISNECLAADVVRADDRLSLDAFRERLASFGPGIWPAYHAISPLELAASGFKLVEPDVVECISCKSIVIASSSTTVHQMSSLHKRDECCPWRFVTCPARFKDVLTLQRHDVERSFDRSVVDSDCLKMVSLLVRNTMSRLGDECPLFSRRTLDVISSSQLKSAIKSRLSINVEEEVRFLSALTVTMCGWTAESSLSHGWRYITCSICRRKCDTSLGYKTVIDEVEDDLREIFPDVSLRCTSDIINDVVDGCIMSEAGQVLTRYLDCHNQAVDLTKHEVQMVTVDAVSDVATECLQKRMMATLDRQIEEMLTLADELTISQAICKFLVLKMIDSASGTLMIEKDTPEVTSPHKLTHLTSPHKQEVGGEGSRPTLDGKGDGNTSKSLAIAGLEAVDECRAQFFDPVKLHLPWCPWRRSSDENHGTWTRFVAMLERFVPSPGRPELVKQKSTNNVYQVVNLLRNA